ncbi:class I SAM-dependent methyltransferase [Bacillota bacterium Meth-B3]
MTALISAYARWHHAQHDGVKVFDDTVVGRLLPHAEKQSIGENMSKGIGFFNPAFQGTNSEALRWIVDNQLAPSPLGRAAFCERHLQNTVRLGARQYLILGAGHDTFGYRQPEWAKELHIFEVDHPATAADKRRRLTSAGIAVPENVHFIPADFNDEHWLDALAEHPAFHREKISLCSLLGLIYYLEKTCFARMIRSLAELLPRGSGIACDYPDQGSYTDRAGERAKKQAMLAGGAKEAMQASYSYAELEALLEPYGFLIYEHLTPPEITEQYFSRYNEANPAHKMAAFDNVNYCLAVRQ